MVAFLILLLRFRNQIFLIGTLLLNVRIARIRNISYHGRGIFVCQYSFLHNPDTISLDAFRIGHDASFSNFRLSRISFSHRGLEPTQV